MGRRHRHLSPQGAHWGGGDATHGGLLTVVVVHYLEVFDGGLGDAAVEVQHVGLRVLVPHRRLVVQLDQVVQGVIVPPAQDALLLLSRRTTAASAKPRRVCRGPDPHSRSEA